jgi:ribosomal protein S18 acetylase RimI-like enzyme
MKMMALSVRDLTTEDLDGIAWSGGPLHPEAAAKALARRTSGEVDYLAICGPDEQPVAIGGVDYAVSPGAGTLIQFAVMPERQSQGLGTQLVMAAESRIRDRGLTQAELSVEEDNLRARSLYERLGYRAFGTEVDSWEELNSDGEPVVHVADCIRMRKTLQGSNN